MTPDQALGFVEENGVVLASAKGPVPRLADVITGESIRGSWWAHPKSHEIFRVFQIVGASPDILVCNLVGGKVTFVHRRLWPALIRAAGRFPAEYLAQAVQKHTPRGHHVRRDTPFPDWADPPSMSAAETLSEEDALEALGDWTRRQRLTPAPRGAPADNDQARGRC